MGPEPSQESARGPSRAVAWLAGGTLVVACFVGVLRCAGDDRKGAAAPHAEASAPSDGEQEASALRSDEGSTPPSSPPTSSDGGSASPLGASSSDADGTGATRDGGGSEIVRAVATGDPKDLALYSSIERELKRDPPPEIRALVRKRHAGATREELVAGARALPDLSLRVLALRWVDEVFPPPQGNPTSPPVPGAKPSVSPSGHPHVQPIAPSSPR